MAEDKRSPDEPDYRAVAGILTRIPPDRPDLLLVELKTLQGPLRFAMPKGVAREVARIIAQNAEKLTADRSAN